MAIVRPSWDATATSQTGQRLRSWAAMCLAVLALTGITGCPDADNSAAAMAKTPVLGLSKIIAEAKPIAPSNNDALITQVLKLINERRARIGLSELTVNPILTQMAEKYAADMIERNFFAHQNPDGQTPGERAYKEGYVFLSVGENLAAGQESAEQAVDEWMASPSHRDIILDPQWTEAGIGIRLGGSMNVYWVMEFGNPP
ncbi:MAG: CAP domain-containing protein [Phycisphaerae bacterium]|nr:CAP domain-containing protein [Phycisphaerae bacterium]